MVNGPATELGTTLKPALIKPVIPEVDSTSSIPKGWRDILVAQGPQAFAKQVREHSKNTKTMLLMDTTMRDAHQSLLATRVRSLDLKNISPFVARHFNNLFALEMWGG